MKDQLTRTCRATKSLVEMNNQATDGSLQQVIPGYALLNSFRRHTAILATTKFGPEAKVVDLDLDLSHLMQQHHLILDILNLNNKTSATTSTY